MTCDECFNELVCRFFWAARAEVRENRYLGYVPEDQRRWALEKEAIARHYHVGDKYLQSLRRTHRRVSLPDFLRLVRWMEDHMASAAERQEVRLTVLDLMAQADK